MDYSEKIKRKINPRERANVFSKLTFFYTAGLFKKGIKNDLEEKDLYEVIKCCQSKRCGDKLEKQWVIDNKNNSSRAIYKLLWHRFGWRYLLIGFIDMFFKISSSVLDPLSVSKLAAFFNKSSGLTKEDAYFWTAVLLINTLVSTIYAHNVLLWAQTLGMEMRTSFSAILYRKALKLTPTAVSKITLGNIITLITKDVCSFQRSIWMLNDIWNGTLQTCVICYLLYSKIGVSSFIGIGIIILVIPLQAYMAKLVGQYRYASGKRTDERLQATQETLSTIKIIKMYTWEKFFSNRINEARTKETKNIVITYNLRMAQIVVGMLFSRIGFYALIMSYIFMGYSTDTEIIFYISTMFKDLEYNLGSLIPYGMGNGAELYSAIKRINQVISAEELPAKKGSDQPTDSPLLELKNANVKIFNNTILKDINLRIESGLTIVTGKVGSGKSSLLKTLLQDYPLTEGYIMSRGRISYASQDPWLFPSSIKQNIIFGEEYNEVRYQNVLKVCALQYDFQLLEKGDETIVCDRGQNLSKGQQARINLARAVYKESEIYLLDDSLTALDSQVQDYIFKECIQKFLKGKICILVTQTVNQLKEANELIIMEDARITNIGKPNDELVENLQNQIGQPVNDLETEEKGSNNIIVRKDDSDDEETNLLEETEQTNKQKIYGEVNRKGKVSLTIYKEYLKYGGGYIMLILCIIFYFSAQCSDSYSDYLLAKWVDKQNAIFDIQNGTNPNNSTITHLQQETSNIIKIYSGIILVLAVLNFVRAFAVLELSRRASLNIHHKIVDKITNTGMSFFDSHFLGNILNRFSQDFSNIDEQVPFVILEFFWVAFIVAGILILISTINKSFLLISFIMLSILVFIRKLYLPTGRSLKRLEATTRSPMVGHINASLEGLTTIRAYKMEKKLTDEFDRHQDLFTSAHFAWQCATEAFGWSLDFLCSIFICLVVLTFIFIDTENTAGDVGLAVSQVIALSGEVEWGIRQWANLEALMTSVERLLEYAEIKPETKEGQVLQNWPTRGSVIFENVSLSYNDTEPVLKNLNFKINPCQKIGVVGRTGAGKSSIISSIFRLYEVQGTIFIDGVNIRVLSLGFLRKKLAIIPQDPILFSGTIRTNLDPLGEFTDQELWQALDKVNIKSIVPDLDYNVKSYGSSFSSGQRQLLSVARAILRKSKIVILDEATANMDHETDAMLNGIIKENFNDCTVFTIAHRLVTILRSDKVMVMDRGEIKQFDDPQILLRDKDGIFYKLVEQAGLLNYFD